MVDSERFSRLCQKPSDYVDFGPSDCCGAAEHARFPGIREEILMKAMPDNAVFDRENAPESLRREAPTR